MQRERALMFVDKRRQSPRLRVVLEASRGGGGLPQRQRVAAPEPGGHRGSVFYMRGVVALRGELELPAKREAPTWPASLRSSLSDIGRFGAIHPRSTIRPPFAGGNVKA